jgi:hypothetical protein
MFTITKPRAPTIPVYDIDFVTIKHDFDKQLFDIPPFIGSKEVYLLDRRGKLRRDNEGKGMSEHQQRDRGCVNAAFKKKHNLSHRSKPQDFAEVFLPFTEDKKLKDHMSFQLLTRWTNLKARLASAGNLTYPDWKDFSERELRQHVGLYVLMGSALHLGLNTSLSHNAKTLLVETTLFIPLSELMQREGISISKPFLLVKTQLLRLQVKRSFQTGKYAAS